MEEDDEATVRMADITRTLYFATGRLMAPSGSLRHQDCSISDSDFACLEFKTCALLTFGLLTAR
jgi:hypothetical protein